MKPVNNGKWLVLVVDDDDSVRFLMIQMLSMISTIECVGAANSEDALGVIRDRRVDAMVLDSLLDRERGMDVYRKALAIDPSLRGKVLFTSGQNLETNHEAYFIKEGMKFIGKPFGLDDFLCAVRGVLEQRD